MLNDSDGNELSKTALYQVGENSSFYGFEKYVNLSQSSALFLSKEPLVNGEPNEIVLSQRGINELRIHPALGLKSKNSGLEFAISQSLPKCTIENPKIWQKI